MKKRKAILGLCMGATMLVASACSGYALKFPQLRGGSLLASPTGVEELTYKERREEDYLSFLRKVDGFASQFAPTVYENTQDKEGNFTVSPVSVFAGLSLAAECAAGETRAEILDALGVAHEELKSQSKNLYRALNTEDLTRSLTGDRVTGRLEFGNSVWVDKKVTVKQACADSLANDFGCYSYQVDFQDNNRGANGLIKDFVKEKTHGLIRKNYDFSVDTLFALINILYLKTVWNDDGSKLLLTKDS